MFFAFDSRKLSGNKNSQKVNDDARNETLKKMRVPSFETPKKCALVPSFFHNWLKQQRTSAAFRTKRPSTFLLCHSFNYRLQSMLLSTINNYNQHTRTCVLFCIDELIMPLLFVLLYCSGVLQSSSAFYLRV